MTHYIGLYAWTENGAVLAVSQIWIVQKFTQCAVYSWYKPSFVNFWWEYKIWKKIGVSMAAVWSRLERHLVPRSLAIARAIAYKLSLVSMNHKQSNQPCRHRLSQASTPQRMVGTIGSEWHESTPSKESMQPAQTSPQSTRNQPVA